jgi:tetratricopeptide (TPR) repeat protein
MGDREKAAKIYQDTLVIFQEIGNRTDEAISLMNIGSMYGYSGNYERALEYYQNCLRIHRDIGSKDWESMLLSGCGLIYHDLGNYEEAQGHFNEALEIAQRIEVDSLISYAEHSLGDLYITQQRHKKAENHLINAYKKSAGKKDIVMDIVTSFAELYLQMGNMQEFHVRIRELQDIYAETKTIRLKARIDLLMGRFYVIAGDFDKAESRMGSALKTFLSLDEPMIIGQAYFYSGYLYEYKGDVPLSRQNYNKALEYFTSIQAKGWAEKVQNVIHSL